MVPHQADERSPSSAGQPGESVSVAELLCAISFATSVGLGDRIEHGLNSAYVALRMAEALGLAADDREAVFYGALLKDAGCTACGSVIAAFFPHQRVPNLDMMMSNEPPLRRMLGMLRYVPLDQSLPVRLAGFMSFVAQCQPLMREAVAGHCEVAELFARRLGFPERVQQAVRYQWERWDGKGAAYRLKGQDAPLVARVLHIAQVAEFAHSVGGSPTAEQMAREQSGTRFDPDLVNTLCTLSHDDDLWVTLDAADAQERILAIAPSTRTSLSEEERVDAVCEALADLIDAKVTTRRGHSRSVAETAAAAGREVHLSADGCRRLRRAALVHDLGIVALPSGILRKDQQLSRAEKEQYRQHPYFTSTVLGRVRGLRELAPDASAHHERADGGGYHRQLSGDQLSTTMRVLVAADRFEELRECFGEEERALSELRRTVGSEISADACDALLKSRGSAPPSRKPVPGASAHELTDRETEVVRLIALGQSNPQIATELVISRKTVEHHVEHIFNKLAVSSRSAAAVYAVHAALV